jgi:hypothetical protein
MSKSSHVHPKSSSTLIAYLWWSTAIGCIDIRGPVAGVDFNVEVEQTIQRTFGKERFAVGTHVEPAAVGREVVVAVELRTTERVPRGVFC